MRKTALFFIVVFLLFSLSGCVVFQKVMDVSGNWIVEIEGNQVISQFRSFVEESNVPRDTYLYTALKLTQTGNQLSGKFYFADLEINVSGSIAEDDTVELEGNFPSTSSQRKQEERATAPFVLSGKAIGSKTLFNKQQLKSMAKCIRKIIPPVMLILKPSNKILIQ